MKNETFCDRFIQLVDYYGRGNKTFFAKLIDVTESNVRSWMNNTLPKVDVIEKIAKNCENLSLEWLVTGAGSMLKSEAGASCQDRQNDSEQAVNAPSTADNALLDRLLDRIQQLSAENALLKSELDWRRHTASDAPSDTAAMAG